MKKLPIFVVKIFINLWPPLLFTGIRLVKATKNWRYVRIEMPLRFYNKNSHGIHFGGSLYSMIDPWYLIMLEQNLGKEYFIIDQSATIEYQKPGVGRVYAEFNLKESELNSIVTEAQSGEKVLRTFPVAIKDKENITICYVEKTLYVRKKLL